MLRKVANGAQREVLLWMLCLKKSGILMGREMKCEGQGVDGKGDSPLGNLKWVISGIDD